MMERKLAAEIERLTTLAEMEGAKARSISADTIVVAEWVRFKCRYGCKGYGKHLSCPPYAPEVSETRRMVREYDSALLLRFDGVPGRPEFGPEDVPADFHHFYRDLILWVNRTVLKLEKTAFYDGFYRAFGMGAYPCIYCDTCVAEADEHPKDESTRRLCRHMDKVRPSMEAAGIDVFATARNAGWSIETIPCRDQEYGKVEHSNIRSFGLVLLD